MHTCWGLKSTLKSGAILQMFRERNEAETGELSVGGNPGGLDLQVP